MEDRKRIFLTRNETLAAIKEDFRQYPPQAVLYRSLFSLVFGEQASLMEDSRRDGVWIRTEARGRMRRVTYAELGKRICDFLRSFPPSMDRLAEICRRVFQARVEIGESDGKRGLWIDTEMEEFSCKKCGHCCRNIGYPKTCSESDVRRWENGGRKDILAWVGLRRSDGAGYRIWIQPGTTQPAESCPWLQKIPDHNQSVCSIHEWKPEICRHYPGSRKHALMTGCTGFIAASPKKESQG